MIDLQMGKAWGRVHYWLEGEKFNKLVFFGLVKFKIEGPPPVRW